MKYGSPAGFRAALEERLKRVATEHGDTSAMRVRKLVVFDRLLARIDLVAPDRWILKGGVALELRLPDRARTTKDLDLVQPSGDIAALADLAAAQALLLGDHFSFSIERDTAATPGGTAMELGVRASVAGRLFERVTVDVGFGDGIAMVPDRLPGTPFLSFAGIEPIEVPALPLPYHVAEKVHAYTRSYEGGRPSSRVKDLIDLILIATTSPLGADSLREALDGTFAARATHPLPSRLPTPPAAWPVPYRRLAEEVGVLSDLAVGHNFAAAFLDPVLGGGGLVGNAAWDPSDGKWIAPPAPTGHRRSG